MDAILAWVMNYMDDWLICSQSQEGAVAHTAIVTEHLSRLGLTLNDEKSQLRPVQSTLYLGLQLDSLAMRAYLSDDRIAVIHNCLALFQPGFTVVPETTGYDGHSHFYFTCAHFKRGSMPFGYTPSTTDTIG
ncbi:UNVERIFIED_CONTAM: hypothetical protein FKN15_017154 [Acipenser sinensis]